MGHEPQGWAGFTDPIPLTRSTIALLDTATLSPNTVVRRSETEARARQLLANSEAPVWRAKRHPANLFIKRWTGEQGPGEDSVKMDEWIGWFVETFAEKKLWWRANEKWSTACDRLGYVTPQPADALNASPAGQAAVRPPSPPPTTAGSHTTATTAALEPTAPSQHALTVSGSSQHAPNISDDPDMRESVGKLELENEKVQHEVLESQELNSVLAPHLLPYSLPSFARPNSIVAAKLLLKARITHYMQVHWGHGMTDSATAAQARRDVGDIIDAMFERAAPTLEDAIKLYAAAYTHEPWEIIRSSKFYSPSLQNCPTVAYVKRTKLALDSLSTVAEEGGRLSRSWAAAALPQVQAPVQRAVVEALNSVGAPLVASPDEIEIAHGGLTLAGLHDRGGGEAAEVRYSQGKPARYFIACATRSIKAADDPNVIEYMALVDPTSVRPTTSGVELKRLIDVSEYVVAAVVAGPHGSNVAQPGYRPALSFPPLASLIPPALVVPFNDLRAKLASPACPTLSLAIVNERPGSFGTMETLLLIPRMQSVAEAVRIVFGSEQEIGIGAIEAQQVGGKHVVIAGDVVSAPKPYGEPYTHPLKQAIPDLTDTFIKGRSSPTSPLIVVPIVAAVVEPFKALAKYEGAKNPFELSIRLGECAFMPYTSPSHLWAVPFAPMMMSPFRRLTAPEYMPQALVLGLAHAAVVGLALAEAIEPTMTPQEAVDEAQKVLRAARDEPGGFGQAAAAAYALLVNSHFSRSGTTPSSPGLILSALARSGLKIKEDDLVTLPALLYVGWDGSSMFNDFIKQVSRGYNDIAIVTKEDRAFCARLADEQLGHRLYNCTVLALEKADGFVRARYLGSSNLFVNNVQTGARALDCVITSAMADEVDEKGYIKFVLLYDKAIERFYLAIDAAQHLRTTNPIPVEREAARMLEDTYDAVGTAKKVVGVITKEKLTNKGHHAYHKLIADHLVNHNNGEIKSNITKSSPELARKFNALELPGEPQMNAAKALAWTTNYGQETELTKTLKEVLAPAGDDEFKLYEQQQAQERELDDEIEALEEAMDALGAGTATERVIDTIMAQAMEKYTGKE